MCGNGDLLFFLSICYLQKTVKQVLYMNLFDLGIVLALF